jgi:hypothetical protein
LLVRIKENLPFEAFLRMTILAILNLKYNPNPSKTQMVSPLARIKP